MRPNKKATVSLTQDDLTLLIIALAEQIDKRQELSEQTNHTREFKRGQLAIMQDEKLLIQLLKDTRQNTFGVTEYD